MPKQGQPRRSRTARATGWDTVADWYAGWTGKEGSHYHRTSAIPAVLSLLSPAPGTHVLELGAGHGVLAPHLLRAGCAYTGVDLSPRLIHTARRHHGDRATFLQGDATRLGEIPDLRPNSFDAVVFLLSIQDMEPLDAVLRASAWALRCDGIVVMLMTHPCFRVPRQSGWGWDQKRKLQFRRVDRYLSPVRAPMQPPTVRNGQSTWSFHRPLSDYINGLGECGLLVERMQEISSPPLHRADAQTNAERRAHAEIPLFLGLRARKGRDR